MASPGHTHFCVPISGWACAAWLLAPEPGRTNYLLLRDAVEVGARGAEEGREEVGPTWKGLGLGFRDKDLGMFAGWEREVVVTGLWKSLKHQPQKTLGWEVALALAWEFQAAYRETDHVRILTPLAPVRPRHLFPAAGS